MLFENRGGGEHKMGETHLLMQKQSKISIKGLILEVWRKVQGGFQQQIEK